jgi:hypothetical protein
MNPWPFILGAYGVGTVATLALLLRSFVSMRRAEAAIEALRRDP